MTLPVDITQLHTPGLPADSIQLLGVENVDSSGLESEFEPILGLPIEGGGVQNTSVNSWVESGEQHSGVLAGGYHQIDDGNNRGGCGDMDYISP